jgi:hypothetical protein
MNPHDTPERYCLDCEVEWKELPECFLCNQPGKVGQLRLTMAKHGTSSPQPTA